MDLFTAAIKYGDIQHAGVVGKGYKVYKNEKVHIFKKTQTRYEPAFTAYDAHAVGMVVDYRNKDSVSHGRVRDF